MFRVVANLAGVLILITTSLAIAKRIRPDLDISIFFMAGWGIVALGAVAAILLGGLFWLQHQEAIGTKASALQGAAWELIKLMENSGPGGAESRAVKAEATTERFAVNGATAVAGRRPLAVLHEHNPGLTEAGLKLMDLYKADSKGFRFGRGGARNGVAVFLSIMRDRNLQAAYVAMVEHMKAQRDELAEKGSKGLPNFPNLKMFLDLPTEWPTGRMPEMMRGQGFYGFVTSNLALQRSAASVLSGLEYKTPAVGDRPALLAYGDDVLKAMREFVRSDDTGAALL
jgi:hypothetical protein